MGIPIMAITGTCMMVDVVEVHTADRFEEAVQAPGKADRHAEDLVPVVEADFPLAVAVGATLVVGLVTDILVFLVLVVILGAVAVAVALMHHHPHRT